VLHLAGPTTRRDSPAVATGAVTDITARATTFIDAIVS
jgi:hypothetical protein